MTNPNRPEFEQRLLAYVEEQPEFSLAWEILQHGTYSWDEGVLSWATTAAKSDCFVDLYGMSAKSDFEEDAFVHHSGQLKECPTILRANVGHRAAPSAMSETFLFHLYFFGLKMRTVDILEHVGINY